MDVVFTLSSLLFEHDRVVVNGLGVFTAELQKAYVHPVEHSFTPEFKKLKFEENAKIKDDLLVKAMGQANANQLIAKFVEHTRNKLKEGNKVQLKNIGFLYIHHTGEIILEQDNSFNYVKKNFGLQPFIQEPVNKIVASKGAATIAAPQPKKRKKPRIVPYLLWSAAIIIAVLAFWKMDTIKSFFNEMSDKKIAENNTEIQQSPKPLESSNTENIQSQNIVQLVDSVESPLDSLGIGEDTMDNIISKDYTMTEELAKEEIEVEPVVRQEQNIGPHYYVIAGCFRSEFKANRLLNDLHSKGFDNANIEGKTPNGLIRVCYAKFPKRRQASNYMLKLKKQGHKGVWIQKGE